MTRDRRAGRRKRAGNKRSRGAGIRKGERVSIFKPHTIHVERLSDEIRRTAGGIAPGNTCAVVERYDGMLVKVCHVGNLRGHGFRALTYVAQQYARSYGAQFVPTDIANLRKVAKRNAGRS